MSLVLVRTYTVSVTAQITKTKLESEGVECFLFDEHTATVYPLFDTAIGGIRLMVKEQDLARAQAILSEVEKTPLTNDEGEIITCPNCQSDRIISNFNSTKGLRAVVTFLLTFLLLIYPFYLKRVHRCLECKHEFKR